MTLPCPIMRRQIQSRYIQKTLEESSRFIQLWKNTVYWQNANELKAERQPRKRLLRSIALHTIERWERQQVSALFLLHLYVPTCLFFFVEFNKRSQYIELEHVYDSVYLNSSSFESALYAAGSLIELLEALVKDEIRNAFAIIRPPGHHAEHDAPMGFCLFNNVAVAVNHCMKKLDVKKTVIVDW